MSKKNIPYIEETYDVVVVGAGHAGCEAALACARLGLETMMFTVSVDSIALMPCNPNIGGSSKGHLVREIDALGGEMGKNIDKTFIQIRVLNTRKGPAVRSLRAQADKKAYPRYMQKVVKEQENLDLIEGMVEDLVIEDQTVKGVILDDGTTYLSKTVITLERFSVNPLEIYKVSPGLVFDKSPLKESLPSHSPLNSIFPVSAISCLNIDSANSY